VARTPHWTSLGKHILLPSPLADFRGGEVRGERKGRKESGEGGKERTPTSFKTNQCLLVLTVASGGQADLIAFFLGGKNAQFSNMIETSMQKFVRNNVHTCQRVRRDE